MAQGKLQPFAALQADVKDNQGQVRIPKGAQLTDTQLRQMDWLVDGVQGSVR
jgi:simple sugar transport system substrate-binding protein